MTWERATMNRPGALADRVRASVRILSAMSLFAVQATLGAAQSVCPSSTPVAANLGFSGYVCYGGSCDVAVAREGRVVHLFTVEPAVRGIDPRGPAAEVLLEGDVIVAIDGLLITTRAGGSAIAQVRAGVPVRLRIRRGARELERSIVPVAGCHRPGILVAASPDAERAWSGRMGAEVGGVAPDSIARSREGRLRAGDRFEGRLDAGGERAGTLESEPAAPPVEFGLTLECGACGWRIAGGRSSFRSLDLPVVVAVDARGPGARAGLVPGDTLVEIAGVSFVAAERDPIWSTLRPGSAVTLLVRRNALRQVSIVPIAAARRF